MTMTYIHYLYIARLVAERARLIKLLRHYGVRHPDYEKLVHKLDEIEHELCMHQEG